MYRLNIYSWALIIVYFVFVTTIEYFSYKVSFEGIYLSLPLIASLIFWSENTTLLIKKSDSTITKTEAFQRDLFLIGFSFISGYILSLLMHYNNSDVRGWWPLAIFIIAVEGVLFAFIFSLIATTLNNHKKYTYIFSYLIILILLFFSFMEYLNPLSIYASDKSFYVIFLCLMGAHLLLCLGYSKRRSSLTKRKILQQL